MSYPPQPPGQSSYQGLGAYSGGSGEPPKKKKTRMIVAIVAIVVLVLGGGGTAVYFFTKDSNDDGNSASAGDKADEQSSGDDSSGDSNQDDASNNDDSPDDTGASNSPDDVRDAYMEAYETKDFQDVVDSSCRAYKKKFGTDTSELETTLADYDITATADGEPDVNGNSASAKIDLELTADGTTETPEILIKIVEEDGEWRFCGEGKADDQ